MICRQIIAECTGMTSSRWWGERWKDNPTYPFAIFFCGRFFDLFASVVLLGVADSNGVVDLLQKQKKSVMTWRSQRLEILLHIIAVVMLLTTMLNFVQQTDRSKPVHDFTFLRACGASHALDYLSEAFER
jgi:hypothetical protein